MASRTRVYRVLDGERAYQDAKGVAYGGEPHKHELESYVLYMENYLLELKNVLSRVWMPPGKANTQALDILRKVTALGVAAMEEHGAQLRDGYCEVCGASVSLLGLVRCKAHQQRGHE